MSEGPPSHELVRARKRISTALDSISPKTYGANTSLLEAIEGLIEVKIQEALERSFENARPAR